MQSCQANLTRKLAVLKKRPSPPGFNLDQDSTHVELTISVSVALDLKHQQKEEPILAANLQQLDSTLLEMMHGSGLTYPNPSRLSPAVH